MSLTEFVPWFYLGVGVVVVQTCKQKIFGLFRLKLCSLIWGSLLSITLLFATKILHDLRTHFFKCL